ncbi:hypothetical protein NUF65_001336 [Yersinia enterocolitica]|nr:hypothetical protein [Yersinia enterocolitica]
MRKSEMTAVMSTLQQAQRTSAVIRALRYSLWELSSHEIETLFEVSSEYADSATECLINLSGEEVSHG